MAEPFVALQERAAAEWAAWERPPRPRIDLAIDTSALAADVGATRAALERAIAARGLAVDLGRVAGYGLQWLQPLATLCWPDGTRVLYGPVTADGVEALLDEASGRMGAAAALAIGVLAGSRPGIPPLREHPFLALERERRLLARVGVTDPESLAHYVATGGYTALSRTVERHQTPEALRQLVIDAGLTGRGGAAFPAGVKWNFLGGAPVEERYLVCNADEGDPGAWVNRVLLEGDPHAIVEGMLIAAFATGARHGFVYIRNEYPLAIARMQQAIAQAVAAGLCGDGILGREFACTLEVVRGAGAYVCGEETGLIASVQDGRGMPRVKPPFPANAGVFMKPSNVNNVETYANVPLILRHGAEWFRELGTAADVGTKIFSFSGDIPRAGVMEVPFGVPLRDALAACGGVLGGGPLKAIQAGGPLAGYLPGSLLDELALERAPFARHGALVGAGGVVFVGAGACSIDLNALFAQFLEEESCGRCTTCHHGNQRMTEIFERIGRGGGRAGDRHNLELLGGSLQYSNCVHGQASPTIMRNTLRFFAAEYEAHVRDGRCEALRCAGLVRFRVADQSDPRLADAAAICPTEAVLQDVPSEGMDGAAGYRIDDAACIRCGACAELAPRGIVREAAPAGVAQPRALPARPPGVPAAAGVMPLTFQGTSYARPEAGQGGAPPLAGR